MTKEFRATRQYYLILGLLALPCVILASLPQRGPLAPKLLLIRVLFWCIPFIFWVLLSAIKLEIVPDGIIYYNVFEGLTYVRFENVSKAAIVRTAPQKPPVNGPYLQIFEKTGSSHAFALNVFGTDAQRELVLILKTHLASVEDLVSKAD